MGCMGLSGLLAMLLLPLKHPICLSRLMCALIRYNGRSNLKLSYFGPSWLTLWWLVVGGVMISHFSFIFITIILFQFTFCSVLFTPLHFWHLTPISLITIMHCTLQLHCAWIDDHIPYMRHIQHTVWHILMFLKHILLACILGYCTACSFIPLVYKLILDEGVTLHTRSRQFPITLQYFRSPYSLCHSYNDQYHFRNNLEHYPRRYRHHCRHLGDFKHTPRLTAVGFASGNLSLCADLIFHT